MAGFAVRNPYFIIVLCLIVSVVGVTAISRMPVDLFPPIDIPVVVVVTFYSGMPPAEIESSITSRYERFFTLAANIDHIESRSLPGVSLVKVVFRPGMSADAAVTNISNLAMANLRRLPPGTLPPLVFKMDASALPVCLVTLKGEGLDETRLRDVAYYGLRNQLAGVPGASVPQPFGGKTRQIMVYVDPLKLAAYQLSPMDVVRSVNESNVILPAGQVRMGGMNYNLYMNNQAEAMDDVNGIPIKSRNGATVYVRDIGEAKDSQQIQLNVVRVDGQRSVYLPILKQGGDSNTIAVVDGIKAGLKDVVDMPPQLKTDTVFDQSEFVKKAINNLMHEGGIGLFLTAIMILVFLGNFRATTAVLLSIPLSALGTFVVLYFSNSSVNTMVLGGLALAFSRLIDNSVVVLENIFRHLEEGANPMDAAIHGGNEVALPVLAATLTTAVVFFPVTFLFGVSRYLFSALAIAVVLSLLASYLVAMTVVPLFCSRFLNADAADHEKGNAFNRWFNHRFDKMLSAYSRSVVGVLRRPWVAVTVCGVIFLVSLALFPALDVAFFPRTDAGQFVMNVKAPPGTRLENTEREIERVEALVREVVPRDELRTIVSNLGVNQDFSAMYTPNSAEHTAFVQVNLVDGHKVGSYEYMDRLRAKMRQDMPHLITFFLSGGLVDSVLNQGLPTPIDLQVSGSNLKLINEVAQKLAGEIRQIRGVNDVYVPQDVDYPALRLDVDRMQSSLLGLSQREIASNVITGLTSNGMIAPNFWVDGRTGNDYMLTVQFPEGQIRNLMDLRNLPLRGPSHPDPTRLDAVTKIHEELGPTEIARYQIRRITDVYVGLATEDLGRVANAIDQLVTKTELPAGVRVTLRGMVQSMRASFQSFAFGLLLALLLLYLILVAQFRSFTEPGLILLAVPMGLTGVLVTLPLTGTSLNVMSLMGVVMMTGIVVSNSILIVDFANRLRERGDIEVASAIEMAARIRLRPILMTSLATIIGLLPMALKLGEGSESYAPLARAIIGGLTVSLIFTVYLVPAGYLLMFRRGRA